MPNAQCPMWNAECPTPNLASLEHWALSLDYSARRLTEAAASEARARSRTPMNDVIDDAGTGSPGGMLRCSAIGFTNEPFFVSP